MSQRIPIETTFIHNKLKGQSVTPKLLLHCCCAPCATSVIDFLSPNFIITLLFFNPNIRPIEEYKKRAAELSKYIIAAELGTATQLVISEYCDKLFDTVTDMFPDEPEGGNRCRACFELRLRKTAELSRDGRYDYFTTTLSVSPHKNATIINEIGSRLEEEYSVKYLHSDFKKNDGYKRSLELSKRYNLYRQNFCGCRKREI